MRHNTAQPTTHHARSSTGRPGDLNAAQLAGLTCATAVSDVIVKGASKAPQLALL